MCLVRDGYGWEQAQRTGVAARTGLWASGDVAGLQTPCPLREVITNYRGDSRKPLFWLRRGLRGMLRSHFRKLLFWLCLGYAGLIREFQKAPQR